MNSPVNEELKRPALERTRPGDPGRPQPYVAGIASGLSIHLGINVKYIRWAFVLSSFVGIVGLGVVLYVWLWATVKPTGEQREYATQRGATKQNVVRENLQIPSYLYGIYMGGAFLALSFLGIAYLRGWIHPSFWQLGVISALVGIAFVWTQTQNLKTWTNPSVLTPIAVGVSLQTVGVLLVASSAKLAEEWQNNLLVGGLVLLLIAASLTPLLMVSVNEHQQTKLQHAREMERADIAAHLHDSVLQTLTLIKANANDAQKVRSLALTQERELRAWLYTGTEDAGTSCKQLLQDALLEIESTYGAEVELVYVGDSVPGVEAVTIVAATAEAVKNSVRHGKPPVRVYAEDRPGKLEIFIRDHGDGFNLADIPEDRHGVRDSIIGRMERAGGTARIRQMETGVEIQLSITVSEN